MSSGIGAEFMEKTQYRYLGESDQQKGLPQPLTELPHDKVKGVVDLPSPEDVRVDAIDLREAIERRRSVRSYTERSLTLEELSWLLWCTQGVKSVAGITPTGRITEKADRRLARATLRTVPGAGARHAFEAYLLANRVEGLHPGLYRFLAVDHRLQEVSLEEGLADKVAEACYRQQMVKMSAATFIWTAVAYRMAWRYGERGYRYLHLDAGHVCQNLYLAAEAIGSGVCAIGAFYDEELNSLLGIDGKEQFAIYAATVGKKK